MGEWVRRGDVAPVEWVDLAIERIEAFEGRLGALTTRAFEQARE
jgi:amidase